MNNIDHDDSCAEGGAWESEVKKQNFFTVCHDIFRAVHEGKWLKIEYRNKGNQVTKYWIGI